MTALLSISELKAGYRDSKILHGLNLELRAGEVICLLGANGAGKTTTMRVLSGLLRPESGRVMFDDQDLLKQPPHLRVENGVVLCPEGRRVFPNLTVAENLVLGSYNRSARKDRERTLAEVYELFPRLRERHAQHAGLMSGGEQQMLAIGRAMMARPRLLLLDEPSLGLAPKVVQTVFSAITDIARRDISILLVEQNTRAALSIASRGYVMNSGRIVFEGDADTLRNSSDAQRAFLTGAPSGESHSA